MTELWAAGLIMFASFLGSFGSLYFKRGAVKLHRDVKSIVTNRELFVGVLIYGVSTVFYVLGVRGGELSVLFPLVSTGYVWVCILSVKYLGEKMNALKWAGICLIVLGVSVIGLSPT